MEPGDFALEAEIILPDGWLTEFMADGVMIIDLPYNVFLLPGEERMITMIVTPDEETQHGNGGTIIVKQYGVFNANKDFVLIGDITYPITVDLYQPEAITDLEATRNDDLIILQWTPVSTDIAGNDEKTACYNVYRGVVPDFEPGPDNRVGRVAVDQDDAEPGFQWYENLATKANLYYLVRVEDEAGYESDNSNLAGVFEDEMDYGDAPDDPYPTLLASDGARHIVDGITYLGSLIDLEPDGQPTNAANGDDLNNQPDEDGVVFRTPFVQGKTATIKVLASVDGVLNTWIDYNQNGSWIDGSDYIIINQSLTAGWNTLTINIPASAKVGNTYIRFRFDSQGGLNYYGLAQNGEVEDYLVKVYPENWGFIPTPVTHTTIVPLNVILTGTNLVAGDVIGVFCDDINGNEICGGAEIWDGLNNQVVFAYGDDNTTPSIKEGFSAGEAFTWKIHHTAFAMDEYVVVAYDLAMPQTDGKFTPYGLSGLTVISGLQATATATPDSACAGDLVQLDVIVLGGSGSYNYSWTSDPPGFTSNLKNPTDNPAADITYIVQVTDGGVTASSSVDVTVQPGPLAAAGYDVTICETDVATVSGSATYYSSLAWTSSGDGVLVSPNSPNATYTPGPVDIANGSTTLTFTVYPISPCMVAATDELILIIISNPTVSAGTDLTVCEGDLAVLAGSTTNSSSVAWTTSGDGVFNNPASPGTIYTPGAGDIQQGNVTLCLQAYPISPCTVGVYDCMILCIHKQQTVSLFAGWSGLSSYLTPFNSNDNYALFNPLISNLIIAYNFDGTFWPGNTNTLDWVDTSGYVIKLSANDDMIFYGSEITNKVLNLKYKWNIVPVLSTGTVLVDTVFDDATEVKLVMEVAGWKLYWPQYSINTLITLETGKSYFAFMNMDASVDFNVPVMKTGSGNELILVNNTPWNDVIHSPGNHVVAFTPQACSNFEAGDFIGGFTSADLCAGLTNFTGVSTGLALQGDDAYTSALDGFVADELIRYKLYRPTSGQMFDLEVTYEEPLDKCSKFNYFGTSVVTGVKMLLTGITDLAQGGMKIYPNPSHGLFNIDGIRSETLITVYNAYGNHILTSKVQHPTTLNLVDQPTGIYLIKIETLNGTYYHKLIIK